MNATFFEDAVQINKTEREHLSKIEDFKNYKISLKKTEFGLTSLKT